MKLLSRWWRIAALIFGGYAVVLAGAAVMRRYPRFTLSREVQPGGEVVMLQTYATDAESAWRASGTLIALFGAGCILGGVAWATYRGIAGIRERSNHRLHLTGTPRE